jgi:hypothetical protein
VLKKIVGSSLGTVGLVLFTLVPAVPVSAEDNPFVGTWKLNLTKSKFDPGPPVRSRTVTIEAIGENAVRWSIDELDASGNHTTVVEMPKFDGKDYPRTASRANAPDTIALKRIDTYTLEETLKRGGKAVATYRQVVSKDGKTRTATQTTGTNARGQAVHDVLVFDKQ